MRATFDVDVEGLGAGMTIVRNGVDRRVASLVEHPVTPARYQLNLLDPIEARNVRLDQPVGRSSRTFTRAVSG